MVKSNPLLPSFSAGELSPRLAARLDFGKYPQGLETSVNVIALAEGGLTRRTGTRFVAEVKDSSKATRLHRFQFSDVQAYQIEMSDKAFRFYRFQGQIVVPQTDAVIANGTFTSDITGWFDRSTGGVGNQLSHDATNGRMTLETNGTAADDIGWAEQVVSVSSSFQNVQHVLKFRVIGAPSDRLELRIGTTSTGSEIIADKLYEVGYHAVSFTPGATTFYVQFRNRGNFRDKDVQLDDVSLISNAGVEIDTPYDVSDLFQITGPQSADVLYLFHGDYPVHKLLRLGNSDWSLVEVAWQDGPYLDQNVIVPGTVGPGVGLTPGATTGLGITVTSSAAGTFTTDDVGRVIRLSNPASGTDWGWGVIVGFVSDSQVTVDIRRDFAATTQTFDWRLGAWSARTGYPATGAFFQQRLIGAATTSQPQTFWTSVTNNLETFSPDSANTTGVWDGTVQDDDSVIYTISANDVNVIRWMVPIKATLMIGTLGGTWTVSSTGSVVTPTDVTVDAATGDGSAQIDPIAAGRAILFVQRAKTKLWELAFRFDADGFTAQDMTRLAQHIFERPGQGIVEMDYAPEPDGLVWVVRGDGTLCSMTYRREEDVVNWSRHVLGGSFGSGQAVVESVSVIPGADGAGQIKSSENRDEVWLVVKRTINGATKRYVELIEGSWSTGDDQEDAYYTDSIITYDGAATGTITGLDHLEGETVRILADGAIHPDRTVASGSVTLDASTYQVVQIGLPYKHTAKTLKMISGTVRGTPAGKIKQIFGVTFIVLNSHTITFGPDTSSLRTIDFRDVANPMDAATPYFTGEHTVEFDDDWKTDPRIIIESDDPVPFTLLAIAPEVDTRETR